MRVKLKINNNEFNSDIEPRLTLLDFIRDKIGLKGTHSGCEHGVCGACTIILNDEAVRSCLILAAQAEGDSIITIEGLNKVGGQEGELNIIQDAFCEAHGLQCGYCTPGMIISAQVLLQNNSSNLLDDPWLYFYQYEVLQADETSEYVFDHYHFYMFFLVLLF